MPDPSTERECGRAGATGVAPALVDGGEIRRPVGTYWFSWASRTHLARVQVHTDPMLGYTEIDGVGHVVAEVSPYEVDLDCEFVRWLTDFAMSYADTVREDHALFVQAFRDGRIGVTST